MNSQGSATGWQPNQSSFCCPFVGCGRTETSTELLRYHMDHFHLCPPQQRFLQALRVQQQSRYAGSHPLRNASHVTSTNAPVSPRTELFQQLAYTYKNCLPTVTNNSQRPAPLHSSMAPPPVQTQNLALNPAPQRSMDEQALSEATASWPATAHALLKDLIISYGVLGAPKSAEEHDKLVELYEKFHADTKTLGMNLAKNDDILWKLFRTKVSLIQLEMLGQGEIQSTAQGLVCTKLQRGNLFLATPRQEPLSTPPTTPVLPAEPLNDGLEAWNAMNGKVQARMIGKILRAAKNPSRIVLECEAYIAEVRGKEEREARDGKGEPSNSNQVKETIERLVQRPTPSRTPDPVAKKSMDLQAMIDESLREMRRKRALAKRAREMSEEEVDEEEDVEAKRINLEQPGLNEDDH